MRHPLHARQLLLAVISSVKSVSFLDIAHVCIDHTELNKHTHILKHIHTQAYLVSWHIDVESLQYLGVDVVPNPFSRATFNLSCVLGPGP
jgi:hypothetical protein